MNAADLKNLGIKVNEKEFEQYKARVLSQNRMRNCRVKNMDNYLKLKEMFSLPDGIKIKKLGKKDGMDIWLVHGPSIRRQIDVDFTTGGHGMRHLFIPINEIWVDSAMNSEEDIEPSIFHELTEFKLMKNGVRYVEAHTLASVVETIQREKIARKNGNNEKN
jgi:hypothetical protein